MYYAVYFCFLADEHHQFSDESAEASSESNMAASPSLSPHVNKKLSLDPHVRLRVEKLQVVSVRIS